MKSRIILPLDHVAWAQAKEVMVKTKGLVWGYKIRRSVLEHGLNVLSEIRNYGRVMLDFKLYDIPSAMTESLSLHIAAGATITTVHCTSGYEPQKHGLPRDHIAGVTILTSMEDKEFNRYYKGNNLVQMVELMAADATTRYEFLVCSAVDLLRIRHQPIKKICPGIRPLWYQKADDQERTATPAQAVTNGADLLVIGRPILHAADMAAAVQRTNEEVSQALSSS